MLFLLFQLLLLLLMLLKHNGKNARITETATNMEIEIIGKKQQSKIKMHEQQKKLYIGFVLIIPSLVINKHLAI